jgi:hypothetical protein
MLVKHRYQQTFVMLQCNVLIEFFVIPSKLCYLCFDILPHTYNFLPRIFLAGKKVMQIALGRSAADEAKTGLHKLSKVLHQIF